MDPSSAHHQLGLSLLAAHKDIHPGASTCASAFIHEMSETPNQTKRKIDEKLREWHGDQAHKEAQEIFSMASEGDITPILSALEIGISELHIIGHDVIQASAALKSLHQLGNCAPQETINAIAANIKANGQAHPGIFHNYTSEEIRNLESSFDDYDADGTPSDVVDSLLNTLKRIKKSYFGFQYMAQETHLVTHAEAIISLYQLGHRQLFSKALKSWHLRLKLLEVIYDLNLDDTHKSPLKTAWDPRAASFWDAYPSFDLYIHPIKTMHSYFNLKRYGLLTQESAQFFESKKLPYFANSQHPDNWKYQSEQGAAPNP